MPRTKRVPAFGPGRPPLARRVLVHYTATCKQCEELPASPRKATAHATGKGHVVIETKHYVVALEEAE